MTLCVGQLHPITVYRTGLCVCTVLVLTVITCSIYYFLNSALCNRDGCDYNWDLSFDIHFDPTHLGFLRLGSFVSATTHLPGCFCPSTLSLKIFDYPWYGLLYVMRRFSTWVLYKGVPCFATVCPCGIWCRGLTNCLLLCWYSFIKSSFKWQRVCKFDIKENNFFSVLIMFV